MCIWDTGCSLRNNFTRSIVLLVVCLLLQAQARPQPVVVMTSGTFTAAHLEIAPEFPDGLERIHRSEIRASGTEAPAGSTTTPSSRTSAARSTGASC